MRLAGFDPAEKSSIKPVEERLATYPNLRFKLDPFNDWDDELIAALVATGAVDSLDLKGFYKGTPVDVITDPELYAKLIEAFPDAWLEDPDVTDETRPLLDPVHERVTWDAPIHSIADIEAMPWSPPKTVNVKPSRFGPISSLFAAYDYCEERGIGAYGGGQTELGPGRGQIQYLASIFHPDTPNDVAPSGYNDPEQATAPGLPSSPLEPRIEALGFRWTGLRLAEAPRRAAELELSATLVVVRLSHSRKRQHQRSHTMAEKSFAAALNEQISNEFGASQQYVGVRRLLRRRNAAPPRRLLLPPGARGARARDDDDPLSPRRRRAGPDPRRQVGARPPTPTAPSR